MENKPLAIKTISQIHEFYGLAKPKHPLITVVDYGTVSAPRPSQDFQYETDFYTIACKQFKGQMQYGRSYYDFSEGTLMFHAPNQLAGSSADMEVTEGWALFFHQDLIHGTTLGKSMHSYHFFNYQANEALHISEDEKQLLADCITKIKREYTQNIDQHTRQLLVSNIELLLNYCNRFYARQFLTRSKQNIDVVARFETLLQAYFNNGNALQNGLPTVAYFAAQLHFSADYLSDLLRRHTGKTTIEHIHLQMVESAKELLLGSNKAVSEIAYDMGFEHPSHFTKIFKAKTGLSPLHFRKQQHG